MKIIIIYITIILFITTMIAETPKSTEKVLWYSFDEGMEKAAKDSTKIILIDVYTDWCSWCKKMDENTYSDKKVQEYLEKNYIIIKLNAEATTTIRYKKTTISPEQFSRSMGVTGYPATLFMKSNGDPITLLPGYAEAPMFLNVLSFIAEEHYKTKKFDDYLKEKE